MRFTSAFAVASVASLALTAAASATTLYSDSSTTLYTGYSATSAAPASTQSSNTYDLTPTGTWSAAMPGSSWISFNQNTAPNGSYAQSSNSAPNGYYTYVTNFDTLASAFGNVSVMADDTVSVYLNGILQLSGAPGPYPQCASSQPNCTTPATVALTGFVSGNNQLEFVVHQAGSYATGLDYSGSVSATPEPGSLVLLGSGLLTGAGAIARRLRRA